MVFSGALPALGAADSTLRVRRTRMRRSAAAACFGALHCLFSGFSAVIRGTREDMIPSNL